MKSVFAAALLASLVIPAIAQAKITQFSTVDAVRKVLDSAELAPLIENHGALRNVEVMERFDSSALQAFELNLTFTMPTPIGPRSCFSKMEVMVTKDADAPRGITASKMLEPVVTETICQK